MRTLVTGHLGYIGCHVVDLLKQEGHYVRGVDVDLYRDCDFYKLPVADESHIKDVFDLTVEDFQGIDAVIHLAALSNDPLGELDPSLTVRINQEGSIRAAELAKKAGVPRFLFSSSCSIYGKSGDNTLAEGDSVDPITVYGRTKIATEQALASLADDSFSPTYLRNATAYGTSSRLRLDLVLNNLAAWAVATGEIRIISDGSPWRPLVHCRDIARAFVHLAQAPREKVHNQAFNVGRSEENYRVRDLVALILERVPGSIAVYTGEGSPDARDYRVDFSKFSSTFPEFQFGSTVRDGVDELLREYERYGLTEEIVNGPKFIRLKALQPRIGEVASLNGRHVFVSV